MQLTGKLLDRAATNLAKSHNKVVLNATAIATCQYLNTTPVEVGKFKKGLIAYNGAYKSTADLAYYLGKMLYPRVEAVAREGKDHDETVKLVTETIATMRGKMPWLEFKRFLVDGLTDVERAEAAKNAADNAAIADEATPAPENETVTPAEVVALNPDNAPQDKAELRDQIALATVLASLDGLADNDLLQVAERISAILAERNAVAVAA